MGKRSIGRPASYYWCISFLEDEALYAPCMVARLVVPDPKKHRKIYHNIRKSMGNFARSKLPETGEEIISEHGQSDQIAWRGKTWKGKAIPADLVPPRGVFTLVDAQQYWTQDEGIVAGKNPCPKRNGKKQQGKLIPGRSERGLFGLQSGVLKSNVEYVFLFLGFLSVCLVASNAFRFDGRPKHDLSNSKYVSSIGAQPKQRPKAIKSQENRPGAQFPASHAATRADGKKSGKGFANFYHSWKSKTPEYDKCSCTIQQKSTWALTQWENPNREEAIAALRGEETQIVYLINLSSNSMFPDWAN